MSSTHMEICPANMQPTNIWPFFSYPASAGFTRIIPASCETPSSKSWCLAIIFRRIAVTWSYISYFRTSPLRYIIWLITLQHTSLFLSIPILFPLSPHYSIYSTRIYPCHIHDSLVRYAIAWAVLSCISDRLCIGDVAQRPAGSGGPCLAFGDGWIFRFYHVQ